jgi:hypothetical protein
MFPVVAYCAPPAVAAVVETMNVDGRGWPVLLALDCDQPQIVFVVAPSPLHCDGEIAIGCTRFGQPIEIDIDVAFIAWPDWTARIIAHEEGHALFGLPHNDHGVMALRPLCNWPDDEEFRLALKQGIVLVGLYASARMPRRR